MDGYLGFGAAHSDESDSDLNEIIDRRVRPRPIRRTLNRDARNVRGVARNNGM